MKKDGMISIVTLSILTLSILSFGLFSWSRQNRGMKQAFEEIVPILHALYAKGETTMLISEKKTDASNIEIETNFETKPVKADKDKDKDKGKEVTDAEQTIVFGYESYNAQDPDFILNGTITAKYRIQDVNGESEKDADGKDIIFVQKGATMVETLNMDDGTYKATFTFTYPSPDKHSGIPGFTYSDCIDHFKGICIEPVAFSAISATAQDADTDTRNAVIAATKHWSKVEFTYKGKTIKLNKKQINTLLGVVKG